MARKTVPRICETCGTEFLTTIHDVAKGWGRFCSQRCCAQKQPRDAEVFFWSNIEKTETCWLWKGPTNGYGYGIFKIRGRPTMAHRFSYSLNVGPIPDQLCVLHRCDVRPCCRPEHLWLGTKTENAADRHAKHRNAYGDDNGSRKHPEKRPRGEANWTRRHPELLPHGEKSTRAKLTNEEATEIRKRYAQGGVSQQKLAAEYDVSQVCISGIVRHKRYKVCST